MFTILTEDGSYLVDGTQVERLNEAKRSRAATVRIDTTCRCADHGGGPQSIELVLKDVVGVVGHRSARESNVVPFGRVARSA